MDNEEMPNEKVDNVEYRKTLLDYLPEFINELKNQLISDQKRFGDTWKHRSIEGQELRIKARFDDYFDQFKYAGIPIPWFKIVGEALIAWVREQKVSNKK